MAIRNNFVDYVRAAASGRWLATHTQIIGAEYLTGKNQPCPVDGGHDCYQYNLHRGCFSCRKHPRGGGDGFELIMHVLGVSFLEAVRMVADVLGISAVDGQFQAKTPCPSIPPPAPAMPTDWTKKKLAARSMFADAGQITAGDPVGRYLDSRGLPTPATADVLRYHPALAYWSAGDNDKPELIGKFPAMLAKITDEHGAGVGLHRIYLTEAGEKLAIDGLPAKKIFKCGDLSGAAVRLSQAGETLGICEGIENALAFGLASGLPVWSGVSASMLKGVKIPASVRTVHIGADPDEPGQRAAHALAQRLANEGREVFIHTPPGAGDWNDFLMTSAVKHG